ncbi:hypothetical protein LINPERHAP2_LOCUS3746 [Linum perenne]
MIGVVDLNYTTIERMFYQTPGITMVNELHHINNNVEVNH